MVRQEVLRANLKEWSMSGVAMQEKTMEAPVLVEAVDDDVIPHIDSSRSNEVEP
jgi:hypothetical protein